MLLVIIVNTKHMPITVNYDIDLVFVGQSTTQPAHSHPNFCSSIYTDLQRESRCSQTQIAFGEIGLEEILVDYIVVCMTVVTLTVCKREHIEVQHPRAPLERLLILFSLDLKVLTALVLLKQCCIGQLSEYFHVPCCKLWCHV